MNVKMWHNGFTYNIRICGKFYYWCDRGLGRWWVRTCQDAAKYERDVEEREGRIEWVKLKVTTGLPNSTIC